MSCSPSALDLPIPFSQRKTQHEDLAISFLMQQGLENPNVISLAAGFVDAETLPLGEVQAAANEILNSPVHGKAALQYGATPGSPKLRALLRRRFATMEGLDENKLGFTSDQLLLTTGSQQFLSLICEILLDPGDICLMAGPTYFVFSGNVQGIGARGISVEADEQGMRTDALEARLAELDRQGELHRVKLIYVVSYYDNPSGACLSAERRRELVEIAQRWSRTHRILILEDAAYRELRYDGPEYRSVWSYDETRQFVIYTQTFSKTFAPGVRVGWGIVPQELASPLCDRKGNEDFGSAHFSQALVASVLNRGAYEPHLLQVRNSYERKRNAMLAAANEFFAEIPGVSWRHPHGGLYVWMSLPEQLETGFRSPLFQAAVQEGVMYVPGELCYTGPVEERPSHEMRLSFGVEKEQGIREGMRRLSVAVKRLLSQ